MNNYKELKITSKHLKYVEESDFHKINSAILEIQKIEEKYKLCTFY